MFLFAVLQSWFLVTVLRSVAVQAVESCSGGRVITIDAKNKRHGVLTSAGYPNELSPSNCRYEIVTLSYFTVYAHFTNFSLPDCDRGYLMLEKEIPDGGNVEDTRRPCMILPAKEKSLQAEKCVYCETYTPLYTLHSKANTLSIVVDVKQSVPGGFKVEWRTGAYGGIYNWDKDPAKNMEPDTMTSKMIMFYLGMVVLGSMIIGTPFISYIVWKRVQWRKKHALLRNQDDSDEETILERPSRSHSI